jgi:ribosomal protein L7/L12
MNLVPNEILIEQIDLGFETTDVIAKRVRELNTEISKLQEEQDILKAQLESAFVTLLALCTTSHNRYNGDMRKVQLIKLIRLFKPSMGLKEAKEYVENFMNLRPFYMSENGSFHNCHHEDLPF